ncbi:MAG: zinc ribbon domain-containing protein, partial [Methanosphaera stadtmanae]|nr:zinc ribbon domain-containing protein [Methanosphaera stadtmanae]
MFCKKCGARINDEDNVCPKCGVSIDTQLSNESTKNLEDEFEELLKPDIQTTQSEEIIWQEAPEAGIIDLSTDSSIETDNSQEKVTNNIIPSMSSEKTVENVVETKNSPQSTEETTKTEINEINKTIQSNDDVPVPPKESESSEEEVTAEINETVEDVETETISTEVIEDDIIVDDIIVDDFILDDSSEVIFEDLNAESTETVEVQEEVIEPVVDDVQESDVE